MVDIIGEVMILAYHTLAPFKTAAMACIICYSTFLKLQLEIDQTAVGGLQGYLIPIAIFVSLQKRKMFQQCGLWLGRKSTIQNQAEMREKFILVTSTASWK